MFFPQIYLIPIYLSNVHLILFKAYISNGNHFKEYFNIKEILLNKENP